MTIPLDPRFIPAFSIEDVLLDKDSGAPLSGGLVYFYEDAQRGTLKPVYQITGTSPNYTFTQLPNPMVLSAIGTFEDAIANPVIPYFYPYDADGNVQLYYVVVQSSGAVQQFVRQAQPYIGDSSSLGGVGNSFVNEISNPQFALVDFDTTNSTYTYNYTAPSLVTTQIAPNWFIKVSGPAAATVTIGQIKPLGSANIETNPGTILNINSNGLTYFRLIQRIYGSPNLWGSGYLTASFVAKTFSGTSPTVNMYYTQSNGTVVDFPVIQAHLSADGLYNTYADSVSIPASSSSQNYPGAYIDIEFELPTSINIALTSIMVTATSGPIATANINYEQTSLDRQIDHLYHYAYPIVPVGTIIDYFGFTTPLHYLNCNYTAYNRIDYQSLFNTITATETVTLTSGLATFTVADGTKYSVGYGVEGTGIPAAATIINISTNTITISRAATASGSESVRFFAAGNRFQETVTWGSSTTFTVANGAAYQVGESIDGIGISSGTTITTIAANLITISIATAYVATNTSLVYFYNAGNGDGSTTFNVPDLRRRSIIGSGGTVVSAPLLGVGNKLGNVGGEESHKQTITELAAHTHPNSTARSNSGSPGGSSSLYGSSAAPNQNLAIDVASQGDGTPFNLYEPSLVANKCIRYQ